MSRQYFADTLTEPIGSAYSTITAITETVLIPLVYTPINAMEARAGKVYELIVGGTVTTGTAGTLTITARIGTSVTAGSNTQFAISPVQNYVPSITTAPFLLKFYTIIRSLGLPGANSTVVGYGNWSSGGAVATASSETAVDIGTVGAAVSVDLTIAQSLWMGVTFSVAPSVIPNFHVWRSLN
jgi:hypothetical protein